MVKLYIVENGQLVPYTRHGECTRCGECCCKNTIAVKGIATVGNVGETSDGYENYEGWSYFQDRGMDQWWKFEVREDLRTEPCPDYHEGKCLRYDERLYACQYFPVNPRDIESFDCGLWFEEDDDS